MKDCFAPLPDGKTIGFLICKSDVDIYRWCFNRMDDTYDNRGTKTVLQR